MPPYIRTRAALEAVEDKALAPWAVRSKFAKRQHPESPARDLRTAFQHDWNRVVHCRAFRKLEYKTQVLPHGLGSDFVRNRLTHTLEATQIGTGIARALGLNEDLVQAIVLAHDLGHPPFGHKGEDELHACCGHFNHNEHSLRIVTEVESRYPAFQGLNLTMDVLEGIEKHETDYDRIGSYRFNPAEGPSLEAQIANFADTIAYRAHDIEDGLESRILMEEDLVGLEFWARVGPEMEKGMRPSLRLAQITRKAISAMVEDVVGETARRLESAGVEVLQDVRRSRRPLAGWSEGMSDQQKELGHHLMEKFYLADRVKEACGTGSRVIRRLYERYLSDPKELPEMERRKFDAAGRKEQELLVAHWIAGMTDRYALRDYERLFGEKIVLPGTGW
ncbi:MAG: dNTP triphosphohydrolase [Candidatus Brocadiae bacterium]|nr:dNTP triphosphohydrolase [Candidatus Brocadiia bacterium]